MSNPSADPTPAAPPSRIPEERVHAALRRAAQLQMEASDRLERQARARLQAHAGSAADATGLPRNEVEEVAVEAGISPEYIRQALLEQEALGDDAEELAPWIDRVGKKMLGKQRSIDLVRVVQAPAGAVLEAMQRVFPSYTYGLTLVDVVGGLPLEGGVMVFQIPRMSTFATSPTTPFTYTANVVDLYQIQISLRTIQRGEAVATEVTLRGDLRTSTRRNVWAGLSMMGMGGASGGAILGGIAIAAGALAPLVVAGAAVGVAGLGWAGGAGYGFVYRHYLKKMVGDLQTLLKVVDTNARTGGGFHPPLQPPAGASGSDVAFPVIGGAS